MAKGRDRPKHQTKRKAKDKAPKIQPTSTSSYEAPMQQVEVVKPRRKPRAEPRAEE
jgi:hypothetical protein